MTINEVINYFDEQCPNQYSTEDKIKWLNEIDLRIFNEIIKPRSIECAFIPYTADDLNTQLIVEEPYTEIYRLWLEKSVAFANREMQSFNNVMIMFNSYYNNYLAWYNSNHQVIQSGYYQVI